MKAELKRIVVDYEQHGEGRPILMLHGWGSNRRRLLRSMEPLFQARQGWKRIYPDLPGHGKTPSQDWITNHDQVLEVVQEFIEAVTAGERFVVVGASAGAYLARGVALHKASMMDGLLLVIPMIEAADAKRVLPAHITLVQDAGLAAGLTPEQADTFNNMVVVQNRKTFEDVAAPALPPDEAGDAEFQATIRTDPKRYSFSFDVDALKEPFQAPVTIIAGRQDAIVGYRQAWEVVENYPRGTFAVLDRAGHFLTLEQEELFRALVKEWLDRVEEYAAHRS
jgi:pimeloyl-ACP methyl ester carboxylesterase